MKVFIGPYPKWISTADVAKLFPKFMRNYIENLSWLSSLCNWFYEKRKRVSYVEVDYYDIWSADCTLALITIPLLKKLKEEGKSYGIINEPDLPEGIEPESLEAWHWALDMMIDGLDDCLGDKALDKFSSGEMDWVFDDNEVRPGPNHTFQVDEKGLQKHNEKMQRGRELFGKYYTSLWS